MGFFTPSMRAQCHKPCGVDDTPERRSVSRARSIERAQTAARHHGRVGLAGQPIALDAEIVD
jgi:hypothetical protein